MSPTSSGLKNKQVSRLPGDITLQTTAERTQHPANERTTATAESGGRAAYVVSANSCRRIQTRRFGSVSRHWRSSVPISGEGGVEQKRQIMRLLASQSLFVRLSVTTRDPVKRFPLNFTSTMVDTFQFLSKSYNNKEHLDEDVHSVLRTIRPNRPKYVREKYYGQNW